MTDLKPCPACGATAKLCPPDDGFYDGRNYGFVLCQNDACSMQGPECQSAEEAVEKWNALPRREDLREAVALLASFVQALDGSGAYWADTGISDQEHLNPAIAFIEKHKEHANEKHPVVRNGRWRA